jgi:hypothetical protein
MEQEKSSPKTCRCGHDISHPLVHPEPKYSAGGWVLLMLGATPSPIYAYYQCSRCQQVLGTTRDPKVLREFS